MTPLEANRLTCVDFITELIELAAGLSNMGLKPASDFLDQVFDNFIDITLIEETAYLDIQLPAHFTIADCRDLMAYLRQQQLELQILKELSRM